MNNRNTTKEIPQHLLNRAIEELRMLNSERDSLRKRLSAIQPPADGDCFPAAVSLLSLLQVEAPVLGAAGAFKLIHAGVAGSCHASDGVAGVRYSHAFVILTLPEPFIGDQVVFDGAYGKMHVLSTNLYFQAGDISPDLEGEWAEYTSNEAREKMVEHGHYGPWDLREDLAQEDE